MLEEVFNISVWPVIAHCDNRAAIDIIYGTKPAKATKWLGTKYFMLADLVKEGKLEVIGIKSNENPSDGLTKSLGNKLFTYFYQACYCLQEWGSVLKEKFEQLRKSWSRRKRDNNDVERQQEKDTDMRKL